MRAKSIFVLLTLAEALLCGCATPWALRHQTICQAETATDIHEQQVLDNLAKFLCDPYTLPTFSYATAAANELTDNVSGNVVFNWARSAAGSFLFSSLESTDSASREKRQNWTMVPITDPRKLELMRCAYQRTLANCGINACQCTTCPDCTKRFNRFYTGHEYAADRNCRNGEMEQCYKCENGHTANLVPPPVDDPCVCGKCACKDKASAAAGCDACTSATTNELPPAKNGDSIDRQKTAGAKNAFSCKDDCPSPNDGTVTSECLNPDGLRWFCYTCNKDNVPKNCGCVGHYGCMYVWVPCGAGRDELAKLTLVILDFAVNTAASVPTKEVYAFLDSDLQRTTYSDAAFIVKSDINVDEATDSILAADQEEGKCLEYHEIEAKKEAIAAIVRKRDLDKSTLPPDLEYSTINDVARQLATRVETQTLMKEIGILNPEPAFAPEEINHIVRILEYPFPFTTKESELLEIAQQHFPNKSKSELQQLVRQNIAAAEQQHREIVSNLKREISAALKTRDIKPPKAQRGRSEPRFGLGLLQLHQLLETVQPPR